MLIFFNILYWILTLACISIFVYTIFVTVKFCTKKDFNKTYIIKNTCLLITSILAFLTLLPTSIATSGIYFKEPENRTISINLNKVASKISVFPKYKSQLEGNIGSYYTFNEDFENAIKYFEKANTYYIKNPKATNIEPWFSYAATVYLLKDDFKMANYYDFKSKNYDRLIGNLIFQKEFQKALEASNILAENIDSNAIKGFIHSKLGNKKEAKEYYDKATSLAKTTDDKKNIEKYKNYDKYLNKYYRKFKSNSWKEIPASPSLYIFDLNK